MLIESNPSLFYLVLTAGLTGVIWIPYILNRLVELGPLNALKNANPDAAPNAKWAYRMINAHRNALENLAVFAPLVLVIEVMQISTEFTANVCAVFFFSRLGHLLVYTLGIPGMRTLLFAVGFSCQALLFVHLLS